MLYHVLYYIALDFKVMLYSTYIILKECPLPGSDFRVGHAYAKTSASWMGSGLRSWEEANVAECIHLSTSRCTPTNVVVVNQVGENIDRNPP